jgi:hypothetical protein
MGMGGGENSSITLGDTEPRINALRTQTSSYGMCIPVIFGSNRVIGNIIWYGDFKSHKHTKTSSSSGGKGGGGGGTTTKEVSYTYTVSYALALCEGKASAIGKVWEAKNRYV